jgi:hypothetical protein
MGDNAVAAPNLTMSRLEYVLIAYPFFCSLRFWRRTMLPWVERVSNEVPGFCRLAN